MIHLRLIIIFAIILCLTSCATLVSQTDINEAKNKGVKEFCFHLTNTDMRIIYSGTYYDFHDLILAPITCTSMERCFGKIMFYPLVFVGGVVDLPLSFVADTLILPYTIPLASEINCNDKQ